MDNFTKLCDAKIYIKDKKNNTRQRYVFGYYGVSLDTLRHLKLFTIDSNVDIIPTNQVREIFRIASVKVDYNHYSELIELVRVMRMLGSDRWDEVLYYIRVNIAKNDPHMTTVLTGYANEYKKWRESHHVQETYRRCLIMWDLARVPVRSLAYAEYNIFGVFAMWNHFPMYKMANIISNITFKSGYNEWMIVMMIKSIMVRGYDPRCTYTKGQSVPLSVIYSQQRDPNGRYVRQAECIINAVKLYVKFLRKYMNPTYQMVVDSPTYTQIPKHIPHDAACWTIKTIKEEWSEWALPQDPTFKTFMKLKNRKHAKPFHCLSRAIFHFFAFHKCRTNVMELCDSTSDRMAVYVWSV